MNNPIQSVKDLINSRTQTQWRDLFREQYQRLRSFLRQNGEVAALTGFLFGIALVFFFKLFVVVGCLIALTYLLLTVFAPE